MKPAFYYCDLVKMNFYFCIGWKPNDFAKYARQKFNHDPQMNLAAGKTLLWESGTTRIVTIWVDKKSNIESLVHECVHAANMALDVIGHKADFENDEIQAYLVGLLFKKSRELK